MIRIAESKDLTAVLTIYEGARDFMKRTGNPNQWRRNYPPEDRTKKDIEKGCLYLVTEGEQILGVFYFAVEDDPSYRDVAPTLFAGEPYGVIHRVAVAVPGRGVAAQIFDYCRTRSPRLMIDTHGDNLPMQRALAKAGFTPCGTVYTDRGEERQAYYLK